MTMWASATTGMPARAAASWSCLSATWRSTALDAASTSTARRTVCTSSSRRGARAASALVLKSRSALMTAPAVQAPKTRAISS